MSRNQRSLLLRYGVAVIATLLATLLRNLLDPVLGVRGPLLGVFRGHHVDRVVRRSWPILGGPSLRCCAGKLSVHRASRITSDLRSGTPGQPRPVFLRRRRGGPVERIASRESSPNRSRTRRTGRRQPRPAKGNRRTPTGRAMAARKRAAVPWIFRARIGRHGDVIGGQGLDRGQPSTVPNARLLGGGTDRARPGPS